ncbi:MAG: hypothetical protein JWQ25_2462 [Daejeonella sp.]|nr:hypothetical protein [Daejeonella sp.]
MWGIIFYRIFANESDEPVFAVAPNQKAKEEPLDDYILKDTATLVLNYRDPFLGKASSEPDTLRNTNSKISEVSAIDQLMRLPAQPAPINWEIVKYNGYIINPANKKLVAIVAVNNVQRMLEEGQIIGGVKVLKNLKDSIKVEYLGKQKYIRLN